MGKNKRPSKTHRIKARIALYMADGHLPWPAYKITLRFARFLEAASREGTWVEGDVLDAFYQAAMAQSHFTRLPFKPRYRRASVRLLCKSGLAEREDGRARWAESEEGLEAVMQKAAEIKAEEKRRYKAAQKAADAAADQDPLGEKQGA